MDAAVAERGLARSRTAAVALIAEGRVTVDGVAVVKPSAKVDERQIIEVAGADRYVSRAAHKLLAALDAWSIDPTGVLALDVGASTGGFTQVLLERGAREVIALDVGHGQLHLRIRSDERVRVVERFNARDLTARTLAGAAGTDEVPSLVVGDLSFIPLGLVLPALVATAGLGADFVLLVKPQFEVGRGRVREGLVTDPVARAEAVEGVLWAAWDLGLGTAGVIASPIVGTHGNREYVVRLRADGSNPTEWLDRVSDLTR